MYVYICVRYPSDAPVMGARRNSNTPPTSCWHKRRIERPMQYTSGVAKESLWFLTYNGFWAPVVEWPTCWRRRRRKRTTRKPRTVNAGRVSWGDVRGYMWNGVGTIQGLNEGQARPEEAFNYPSKLKLITVTSLHA